VTWLFLHFSNVAVTFRIGHPAKTTRISNTVVPFSNFGNWITFGPLRIRCLFYIWTTFAHYRPHLRCCYYFASHKKICFL